MMRKISVVVLAAVLGSFSCGVEPPVQTGIEELGSIEGIIDPATGSVTLTKFVPAAGREQALTAVIEDKNGVRGSATAIDTAEFAVECNGGVNPCIAPSTAPAPVVLGCGNVDSFELDVTVRAFFPGGLASTHVEFSSISNLDVPANNNNICNSDAISPNFDASGRPLSAARGLFAYGLLSPNLTAPTSAPAAAAETVRWKFRNPGGRFKFVANLFGTPCTNTAQCAPATITPAFWQAEGAARPATVSAIAEGTGVAYLVGDFTYVGPRTGSSASLTPVGASAPGTATLWPAAEGGSVFAVAPDGAGGAYIGGTFTAVGGVARNRLAHINASGALDLGFVGPAITSGTVRALALADGRLFVGGTPIVASPARTNAFAVNATTGVVDTGWVPAVNGEVRGLIAVPGTVFAGGAFTTFGGAATRLAAVTTTTAANAWTQPTLNSTVNDIALSGGILYAGGAFNNVNGLTRGFLAAFATDGTLQTWNPTANKQVLSLEVEGGLVWLGGGFTFVNSTGRTRLAAVDPITGVLAAPNPGANAEVDVIAGDSAGRVYVGGRFSIFGGSSAQSRLAAVDGTGAVLTWAPKVGPNNSTNSTKNSPLAIAVSGGNVVVGGSFVSAGGENRLNAAALSLSTGAATAWAPALDNIARTVVVDGSRVYIGGAFTNGIGAFDLTTGGVATGFAATIVGSGSEPGVHAIAIEGGNVVVGGSFTVVSGLSQEGAVALTGSGSAIGGWNPAVGSGGVVRALGVRTVGVTPQLVIGGAFSAQGATNLGVFGATSGAGTLVTALSTDAVVRCVGIGRDFFAVGGNFSTINAVGRQRLAVVTPAGVSAMAIGLNSDVNDCDVVGNHINAGGAFSVSGSTAAKRFAIVNVRGNGTLGATGRFTGVVNSVAAVGPLALVGGSFVDSPVSDATTLRTGATALTAD